MGIEFSTTVHTMDVSILSTPYSFYVQYIFILHCGQMLDIPLCLVSIVLQCPTLITFFAVQCIINSIVSIALVYFSISLDIN